MNKIYNVKNLNEFYGFDVYYETNIYKFLRCKRLNKKVLKK
jgi:hypothetical protein